MEYFLKRTNDDFVINIDLTQYGSGYNVVPKTIDPCNAYDIAEVQAYAEAHPEMEVVCDGEKYIPLYNPEMLLDLEAIESEKSRIAEIATLKAYLADTDYIYPKCLELGLDVDVAYADVVAQRKLARIRIQELEV